MEVFLSAGFPIICSVVGAFLDFVSRLSLSRNKNRARVPVSLPGLPILAISGFFGHRHDFINRGFHATGKNIYQFNLLRNKVIVLSGENARKKFFTTKGFDLKEGFKILSGAIPTISGVTTIPQTRRVAQIHKRLGTVQRLGPLFDLIPVLIEDSRKIMEGWGTSGAFDPFDKIYELTFQTTVRSLSCTEIADDATLVARLKKLYDILDYGTTSMTVLLPWIPTPAMLKKLWATKEICDIVTRAIKAREESGTTKNDTLQMLLDSGDDRFVTIGFIMGLLVAGARATGTTESWIVTFLAGHPEWRVKVEAEVERLLSECACAGGTSLSAQLSSIPLGAWESQTPVLDSIIKETLRVAQSHVAMRKNLGPDVYIDDKVVPSGAYIVYPFSDVHLNAELYPDPWKFDPERKEPKAAYGFVGWGTGTTTCLGTRLAKVELKVATSLFLLGFRCKLVDRIGNACPVSQPRRAHSTSSTRERIAHSEF